MKKTNLFRNNETAQQIAEIVLNERQFCEMYSISNANMNTDIDNHGNKVTQINETDVELSKQIIESLSLDVKHFDAVKRIEIWVDCNAIVVFVGSAMLAHCKLAQQTAEQTALFETLFNESIDKTYYESKSQQKRNITALTESKHKFTSIDKFQSFFSLLAQLVTARKKALADSTAQQTETAKETAQQTAQQTETAKETAQQTATKEKKAQQKQKRQQKQKQKKETADFSKVDANELAELTKEIVESEMKAK